MYAKLVNGVPEYAPEKYKLSDGRIIVGFNKSEVLMTRYGFKAVIDKQPVYDVSTEYIIITGYTETETNIIVQYAIKQMDKIEEELTIDERIEKLNQVDTEHEEALAQLTEMLLTLQEGSVE